MVKHASSPKPCARVQQNDERRPRFAPSDCAPNFPSGEPAGRALPSQAGGALWLPSKRDHDEQSDVDLAVEGLPSAVYFHALADLMDLFAGPVDLVRIEEAMPSLLARIQEEGQCYEPSMQRLRAEIASDLQIFASRVDVLTSLPCLSDAGRPTLAEAAVALHHAYGAIESALSRIARPSTTAF